VYENFAWARKEHEKGASKIRERGNEGHPNSFNKEKEAAKRGE